MRNMKKITVPVGFLLTVGVASGIGWLVTDPWMEPQSSFPPSEYPSELLTSANGVSGQSYGVPGGTVGLEVIWNVVGREVHLEWMAMPEGPGPGELSASETYPFPFWPTAFAKSPHDPDVYFAAGWTRRGRTRIIQIELGQPSLGVSVSPTGEPVYALSAGGVESVREVYDEATSSVGFIGNLTVNRKIDDHLFVHELPGGDVYDLALADGQRALIASSSGSGALFALPELGGPYRSSGSTEHAVLGHSYVFSHVGAPPGGASSKTLAYFDSDKDGDVDSALTLTNEEYRALGMTQEGLWSGWD
jgi:hypothetical protein